MNLPTTCNAYDYLAGASIIRLVSRLTTVRNADGWVGSNVASDFWLI